MSTQASQTEFISASNLGIGLARLERVLDTHQPALLLLFVVGRGGAPDGAAAGVYRMVGRHPEIGDLRVTAQLLASRRASR